MKKNVFLSDEDLADARYDRSAEVNLHIVDPVKNKKTDGNRGAAFNEMIKSMLKAYLAEA